MEGGGGTPYNINYYSYFYTCTIIGIKKHITESIVCVAVWMRVKSNIFNFTTGITMALRIHKHCTVLYFANQTSLHLT